MARLGDAEAIEDEESRRGGALVDSGREGSPLPLGRRAAARLTRLRGAHSEKWDGGQARWAAGDWLSRQEAGNRSAREAGRDGEGEEVRRDHLGGRAFLNYSECVRGGRGGGRVGGGEGGRREGGEGKGREGGLGGGGREGKGRNLRGWEHRKRGNHVSRSSISKVVHMQADPSAGCQADELSGHHQIHQAHAHTLEHTGSRSNRPVLGQQLAELDHVAAREARTDQLAGAGQAGVRAVDHDGDAGRAEQRRIDLDHVRLVAANQAHVDVPVREPAERKQRLGRGRAAEDGVGPGDDGVQAAVCAAPHVAASPPPGRPALERAEQDVRGGAAADGRDGDVGEQTAQQHGGKAALGAGSKDGGGPHRQSGGAAGRQQDGGHQRGAQPGDVLGVEHGLQAARRRRQQGDGTLRGA